MAVAETGSHTALLFRRVDAAEYKLCMQMNCVCRVATVREFFAVVSRLGDGVFWYTPMVLFPLVDGERGMHSSLRMAVAGGGWIATV